MHGVAFENIMRIVNEAMPQITEQIIKYMPDLIQIGIDLIGAIRTGYYRKLAYAYEYCRNYTRKCRKNT